MKCQRNKFFLQRKSTYLNCAYMSPLMKKVENAGIQGLKSKRRPYQISPEDFFHESDSLRLAFSELIGNEEPNRIVIIPSVSYGISNVIHNLPFTEGEIVLAETQFPSNVYPWQRLEERGCTLRVIHPSDSSKRGESWNAELLGAINEQTKVVALSHVHWSDGTLFDLKAIRKKLDDVGGLLIIDGTQSVGALPINVKEIRPDALICAGYKWLMGPYSIGLAYYGPYFDQGNPIEENWINRKNSDDFTKLVNYQQEYREDALRYEVGEHSNFILVPMLRQAIKQVNKWSPVHIQQYTQALMSGAVPEMRQMGYSVDKDEFRAHHLFGVRLPEGMSKQNLQNSLKKNRVSVSFRGDAIRVSPHVYNDEMDVRKLLNAMKEAIFA